ncbi:tRNA(His) guanylyltransferase 1 isoform X1 [Tanacetum coccineum]
MWVRPWNQTSSTHLGDRPCSEARMANSKYEYVKSFELEDEVMYPNLIVVRIYGHNFERFSEINEFEKPNDERALNLMNSCATSVMERYPDFFFAYGYGDEYSFIFKKETEFHRRRESKILSIIGSFFISLYVEKWKEFFPQKDMRSTPPFRARVITCPSADTLQAYLAWRQRECHSNNMYNTCFWMLVKSGKSEIEAREKLKVDETFEIDDNEAPVIRLRKRLIVVHSKNIASKSFWNGYSCLCKEIGCFEHNVNNIKPEYIKLFQSDKKLLPFTWTVIRIDGSHFHRFSDVHGFEKPNDEQALKLMNSCAVAVLEEFNDFIFAYGESDEYSFVLKGNSELFQRRASEIVSAICLFFTATYVMKWKEFFPQKELKCLPNFDGRAVCYPTYAIIRDYLAWRQVDYGQTQGRNFKAGTQTQEKNQILSEFGIDYSMLPIMFRNGSCVFWDKETTVTDNGVVAKSLKKVVVEHSNIIEDDFWEAHPLILEETS